MSDVVEHEYAPETVACGSCNAANVVPRQRPEDLATPNGVKWECSSCGAANVLGGGVGGVLDRVVECSNCNSTYDNREGAPQVEVDADGSWSCPSCETTNRVVAGGETAGATQTGEVTP